MPVTFSEETVDLLKKQVNASSDGVVQEELSLAVDSWVDTKASIEDVKEKVLKPLNDKLTVHGKVIQAYAENQDPAEVVFAKGFSHEVKLGAKANSVTEVDLEQVVQFLGVETFLKLASVKITDLRAYLTPEQFEAATTTQRKGNRTIKVLK